MSTRWEWIETASQNETEMLLLADKGLQTVETKSILFEKGSCLNKKGSNLMKGPLLIKISAVSVDQSLFHVV